MPIHQLEHELSALFPNISHGEGLAILIPSWMEVCKNLDQEKMVKFCVNVLDVDKNLAAEEIIVEGIRILKEFFKLFNLSLSLKDYNVSKDDIIQMVNKLTNNHTKVYDSNIPLDYDLALKIYLNSL